MKIAIVTDIHHGPQSHTKQHGFDALSVLDQFVAFAEDRGADLVLDLGDHISDTDHDSDYRNASEVAERLSRFSGPRVHVTGNHDVNNLSIAENTEIFGQPQLSRVIDLGDIRLIVWQPGVKIDMEPGFPLTGSDLPWLVDALNADDRPAIIATHVPLSGHSQIGNYYFEANAQYSTYPDHQAVRAAVEATGKAALWLAGHVHWNTVTNVRNIQHVTIQSLSERFTTAPQTACAFTLLTIEDGTAALEVVGNDPFYAEFPFRKSGDQPWMKPMRPFHEINFQAEAERASA